MENFNSIMKWLNKKDEILKEIENLKSFKRLFLDTEIADYMNPKKARLSLIQILPDLEYFEKLKIEDLLEKTIILDVLDQYEPIEIFINTIMTNDKIEKVFHNKKFDLRYLGSD